MIVIGVVENLRERNTYKILKEIFYTWNYETIYENKTKSIIILNQNKSYIMIIDISPENTDTIKHMAIDFNIIIHTFLKPADYENHSIKDMFLKSKYIIVNSDEDKWTSLIHKNRESIVITYGFNNKSSINPSSYNIHDIIEANISFQRVIYTILGEEIDPFELPIKLHSRSKVDLYSLIASMTCGLILGIDFFSLNEVLELKGNYMR